MLILTRKCGEKISIGNNVTLIVKEIHKSKVSLAFDAPRSVDIVRTERKKGNTSVK